MKISTVIILLILISCSSGKNLECNNGISVTLEDASNLDGCTWLFRGGNNAGYEPVNLSDFIKDPVDGTDYSIEYEEVTDMASICQSGQIIRLLCIKEK